jgi:LysR family hydrogen peroxide-inducible transcriptional activator
MNLRDLRYLLAVAEHRHFGRAATALGVSQPTLSIQLRKLEETLGVALFERSPRQVTPTATALALLPHARIALDAADALAARAAAERDPLRGRLRLGLIPTLAPYLLPLIFAPLRAALPGLSLEPWEDVTQALLDRLARHELDAAILATDTDSAAFMSQPLFSEPFLAALPPDHRLAAASAVSEADLAPDILVLADGHCLRDQALAACGQADARSGALRAASLPTLMNMVAAGYGTTLVPALAAGTARELGLALRPLTGSGGRTVRLAWRRGSARGVVISRLADIITARLAGFAAGAAAGQV